MPDLWGSRSVPLSRPDSTELGSLRVSCSPGPALPWPGRFPSAWPCLSAGTCAVAAALTHVATSHHMGLLCQLQPLRESEADLDLWVQGRGVHWQASLRVCRGARQRAAFLGLETKCGAPTSLRSASPSRSGSRSASPELLDGFSTRLAGSGQQPAGVGSVPWIHPALAAPNLQPQVALRGAGPPGTSAPLLLSVGCGPSTPS